VNQARGRARRLENKVAIVTGAGQGIGKGIALLFAREGARVVTGSRRADVAEATVREIDAGGGTALFVETDIRGEPDCRRIVETALDRFGRLDVLVNNAGIGLLRSVTDSTEAEYDRVLDTNLKGAFFCCKYAIPVMIDAGGGSIINLASVASFVGFEQDPAYCASKGGLLMLTKQLALEYARKKVRVNAICPGFVITPELEHYLNQKDDPAAARREVEDLHPLGRLGTPEDVAYAALYLASDESSWVTGCPLIIDGGMLTR
jgi:NAD(P)-dependent dehydrogenase (short-subunit alcohol dehydrogenase family)